ncbi:hypothetical protein FKM82_028041 [Ascaphus truei]
MIPSGRHYFNIPLYVRVTAFFSSWSEGPGVSLEVKMVTVIDKVSLCFVILCLFSCDMTIIRHYFSHKLPPILDAPSVHMVSSIF